LRLVLVENDILFQHTHSMSKGTLAELPVGASATVERVLGERRLAIRLMELGLVPGTTVQIERKAPLGDPVELSIRGYGLSIRRVDAERIVVKREPSGGEAS
jgi:ferrous iron transport protein A